MKYKTEKLKMAFIDYSQVINSYPWIQTSIGLPDEGEVVIAKVLFDNYGEKEVTVTLAFMEGKKWYDLTNLSRKKQPKLVDGVVMSWMAIPPENPKGLCRWKN